MHRTHVRNLQQSLSLRFVQVAFERDAALDAMHETVNVRVTVLTVSGMYSLLI